MKISRRIAAVLAGCGLTLSMLTATAPPSSAAMVDGCLLSVSTPTTDGVSIFGYGIGACSGGHAYMDYTNSMIQRQETIGWSDGAMYYGNPIEAQCSIKRSSNRACNGTGTRTWRVYAVAGDIYGGTSIRYIAGTSLTC